jgi:hypothetical protein
MSNLKDRYKERIQNKKEDIKAKKDETRGVFASFFKQRTSNEGHAPEKHSSKHAVKQSQKTPSKGSISPAAEKDRGGHGKRPREEKDELHDAESVDVDDDRHSSDTLQQEKKKKKKKKHNEANQSKIAGNAHTSQEAHAGGAREDQTNRNAVDAEKASTASPGQSNKPQKHHQKPEHVHSTTNSHIKHDHSNKSGNPAHKNSDRSNTHKNDDKLPSAAANQGRDQTKSHGTDKKQSGEKSPAATAAGHSSHKHDHKKEKHRPADEVAAVASSGVYPFEVDEADHAETPVEAYRDIAPLLGKLAGVLVFVRRTIHVCMWPHDVCHEDLNVLKLRACLCDAERLVQDIFPVTSSVSRRCCGLLCGRDVECTVYAILKRLPQCMADACSCMYVCMCLCIFVNICICVVCMCAGICVQVWPVCMLCVNVTNVCMCVCVCVCVCVSVCMYVCVCVCVYIYIYIYIYITVI